MAVFISYSHEDEKIVDKIADNLIKNNVHIWIDKLQLNYGDSLIQKVQDAIMESSVLLIMLSANSVQSEWCKKELSAGLIRELDEKRVVTIPVLLENCEIPLFLRDKYYADFRTNFSSAMKKLQENLLKNTDISLNRVFNDDFTIDWGITDGIKDDKFFITLDSVSYSKKSEHSIICLFDIEGNENIKKLYINAKQKNKSYLIIDQLLDTLVDLDKKNDFRVILSDAIPQNKELTFGDTRRGYIFNVRIYIRRLGVNNGFDLLFDFGSIIRLVNQKRDEISRKL
jgi:hypothetical protein